MEIRVELFLRFRQFRPCGDAEGAVRVTVPDGTSVSDLLAGLDIPDRVEKVVLIDGLVCLPTTVLTEGQTVTVFPPLEGG